MPLQDSKKSSEREREADKDCSRQNLMFSHPMRHDISVERFPAGLPVTGVIRDSKVPKVIEKTEKTPTVCPMLFWRRVRKDGAV